MRIMSVTVGTTRAGAAVSGVRIDVKSVGPESIAMQRAPCGQAAAGAASPASPAPTRPAMTTTRIVGEHDASRIPLGDLRNSLRIHGRAQGHRDLDARVAVDLMPAGRSGHDILGAYT